MWERLIPVVGTIRDQDVIRRADGTVARVRRGVVPERNLKWLQASLLIDDATGSAHGERAANWLRGNGASAQEAAKAVNASVAGSDRGGRDGRCWPSPCAEQPTGGFVRSHTHWGEAKRILASMWIWTNVTQGDHIYAPAVRPVLAGRRPAGKLGHYIHTRWRFMAAGRDGHYEALRERLDPYANRLAARIDAGLACPAGGPCGQSALENLPPARIDATFDAREVG